MLHITLRLTAIQKLFRRSLVTGVALACTPLAVAVAAEVNYPTRPVRMWSASPTVAPATWWRASSVKKLTEAWGQQFVVDNRAGAAGMVASEMTARGTRRTYAVFVSSSFSMQPSATPNLPYDIQRDFRL